MHFLLPSMIIWTISKSYFNKIQKQIGSKFTNHNPWTWSFELNKVNVCFLRGLLRWLTTAKKSNHWLRRVCALFKGTVRLPPLSSCTCTIASVYPHAFQSRMSHYLKLKLTRLVFKNKWKIPITSFVKQQMVFILEKRVFHALSLPLECHCWHKPFTFQALPPDIITWNITLFPKMNQYSSYECMSTDHYIQQSLHRWSSVAL